ncbi:hypothetical protein ARMSODRAFT_562363 [Armillaria solidipes]|uniref:Uncharacterized protein n=1 Tax=Armillaria solidipes TaxID=1076256 RepID=A0A2H3AVV2_9AGAR|nr:hypothetical protein ARMSODRAFT_562363 [Armillaria solidipes]
MDLTDVVLPSILDEAKPSSPHLYIPPRRPLIDITQRRDLFSFSFNGITLPAIPAVSHFVLLLPSCKTVITGRRPGAGASKTRLAPIPHLQPHRFVISIYTLHSRHGLRFWHIVASMPPSLPSLSSGKFDIPGPSTTSFILSRRSTLANERNTTSIKSPSPNNNSSPAHVLRNTPFLPATLTFHSLLLAIVSAHCDFHPTPSATFTIGRGLLSRPRGRYPSGRYHESS